MAKKRVQHNKKGFNYHGLADVLVVIAACFLVINAAIVFIFPNMLVKTAMSFGVETTNGNWMLLGSAWLFLAFFAYLANRMVKVTMKKANMWALLLVGLLVLLSGRLESALLIIISSILYMKK